jgi:hypothetical protein
MRIDELTGAQLWELVTGISVHPDHFSFADDDEMDQAWRDHEATIREWRDRYYSGDSIWIKQEVAK